MEDQEHGLVEKADYCGQKLGLPTVSWANAYHEFILAHGVRFETKKLVYKLILYLKGPCDTQQRQNNFESSLPQHTAYVYNKGGTPLRLGSFEATWENWLGVKIGVVESFPQGRRC